MLLSIFDFFVFVEIYCCTVRVFCLIDCYFNAFIGFGVMFCIYVFFLHCLKNGQKCEQYSYVFLAKM